MILASREEEKGRAWLARQLPGHLASCYAERMNERVKKLTEEAAKLTPLERTELVEEVLASLSETDPEIDRAWAAECEDRLAAYERGEISAVDADVVLAKYLPLK
jgi:putative addiction module component (TIGR02574 family)